MLYNVLRVENKNADWKIVDVAGVDGTTLKRASINRTDKKTNAPFPNFDLIQESYQFEANPWTNTSGKHYLFPPRPKTSGGANGGTKGAGMAVMQERKRENIKEAMDSKEHAIKVAGTASQATQILVALMTNDDTAMTKTWQQHWLEIRSWLWDNYGVSEAGPIPF